MPMNKVSTRLAPDKNAKKNLHLALVLDHTTTMAPSWETLTAELKKTFDLKAYGGLNATIDLTQVAFGDRAWTTVRSGQKPSFDQPEENMTALYDGINEAIKQLVALGDSPNSAFLIVIVTDGRDTASRRTTLELIAKKIEVLRGSGRWEFVFCGPPGSKRIDLSIKKVFEWKTTMGSTRAMMQSIRGEIETWTKKVDSSKRDRVSVRAAS